MADNNRNRGQQKDQGLNRGQSEQVGNRSNKGMEQSQNVSSDQSQQSQRSGLGSTPRENTSSERNMDRREKIRE